MFGLITYRRPINLVIAMNIMAFLLLYYYNKNQGWQTILTGLVVTVLICSVYFFIIIKSLGDEYLFLIVSMLISIGLLMIYRLDPEQGFKQVIWFITGIFLFFLSYYIFLYIKRWNKLLYFYILTAAMTYIITILLGRNINGATNWIVIGGFNLQTSELVKILFIFFLSAYFSCIDNLQFEKLHIKTEYMGLARKLFLMVVVFMNIGFLVLQKEWGTAVLLMTIYFTAIYVSGTSYRFILINLIPSMLGLVAGYFVFYHIKVRFEIWLDPWSQISDKGYQITQSLFAISTGGFFGTGIGMGNPDLIPVANTDFIFSAICEEMGIFGGVSVILLYLLLSYRGFKIALKAKDTFYKFMALGITAMFGFQTFIIIGGVIKLIPLTGITLPFISYGGSSLITSFIILGILQAISKISSENGEGLKDERK